MNERAFPITGVENVEATRAFYQALGFRQTYRFPADGEPVYVTMSRGDSSIGIGAETAVDEDRYRFWVYVDDVDATLERLRASGAQVVTEPEDQASGTGSRPRRPPRLPRRNDVYLGATI